MASGKVEGGTQLFPDQLLHVPALRRECSSLAGARALPKLQRGVVERDCG